MIYCAQTLNPSVGHVEKNSFIGRSTLIQEVVLSSSDFKSLFTEKDVTADNFYDCFNVDYFFQYDNQDTINEWGEVTRKASGEILDGPIYVFFPKSLMLNGLFDMRIKTPEAYLRYTSPNPDNTYTINNKYADSGVEVKTKNHEAPIEFEITRARGKFYDCNIPEDIWNIDDHGNRYLAVDITEIYPDHYYSCIYLYETGMVNYIRAVEWGGYYLENHTGYIVDSKTRYTYKYDNPSALWGDFSYNGGNDFFHMLFLGEPGNLGG